MILYLLTFGAGMVVGGLVVGVALWATLVPLRRAERVAARLEALLGNREAN